jgi:hypothetical protein
MPKGWHLRSIMIEMPENGEKVMFQCKKWLISDQKDGKVYAYLQAKHSKADKSDREGIYNHL